MFGVKYLQGSVAYDPDEDIVSEMLLGLVKQDTRQVSFGGGFSYNLVPYHRQPGPDGKGLRNLTFNVTAIPMVTLFNQFTSTMRNNFLGEDPVMIKNVINGKLHVNYVFKAGAIYSWDRFFLGLSGSYDSYNYRGATDVPAEYSEEGVEFDKIHSSGRFSRWSASLKLCVNHGGLSLHIDVDRFRPHQFHQLLMHNLHHQLAGLDALYHVAAHGLGLHLVGEFLGYRITHIGVEQGLAHLLDGLRHIDIGNRPFATKGV